MFSKTYTRVKQRTYSPFDSCIYCGSTDQLSDEHIIPFGLGGTLVLPKSSCAQCATVTSKFEMAVLRREFQSLRVLEALQSRSKLEKAPKAFPLTIKKRGKEKEILLHVKNHPIFIHFPRFNPPGMLTGRPQGPGVQINALDSVAFGMDPVKVLRRLGAEAFIHHQRSDPNSFARMLAKIALGYAAAEDTLVLIEEPSPLRKVILGEETEIGNWVGNFLEPNIGRTKELHHLILREDKLSGYLIAEVQLFSNSETPNYLVVVGKLK